MSFLLDTNVVSEFRKRAANPGVQDWHLSVRAEALHLSVLVVGELYQGVARLHRRNDGKQAARLESWLSGLQHAYSSRILPVDAEVAAEWGRLNSRRTLPVIDGLLVATALVHRLTFVTRNTQDIADTGVPFLNPFS